MLASRTALDSQGRLILRESGKIILPFEHFANAVMLKHMNGPHGLHLSLEATIRAVIDSYTIGRDNYGMERDFIVEVVQNCPSATCRFYKAQLDLSQPHNKPTYIPEVQPPVPTSVPASISLSVVNSGNAGDNNSKNMAPPQLPRSVTLTPPSRPPSNSSSRPPSRPPSVDLTPAFESIAASNNGNGNTNFSSCSSVSSVCSNASKTSSQTPPVIDPSPPPQSTPIPPPSPKPPPTPKPLTARQQQQNKLADFLKANLENFDNISSSKDDGLSSEDGRRQDAGEEKVIRAFIEIMKNIGRMKSCVRPSMCKPYGKQSEALQKTVIDTIQTVQSLRAYLPPSHIAVSSWKNEDKHSRLERKLNANSLTNANSANSSAIASSSSNPAVISSAMANAVSNTNSVMVNASTSATPEDMSDKSSRSSRTN